jgi:hypothetical protein
MALKTKPKRRQTELVVQELKGELLIYDLNTNKAFCLNPTSAAIWNLCDGNNSVTDITKQAGKKLKQAVTDDLVWLALDQFKADNLLDSNQAIEIKFDGLSRREVIRKIGFASMIALPVITSLVAPTAAQAQSLLPSGTSCSNGIQCASGQCAGVCSIGGACGGPAGAPCAQSGTCTSTQAGVCTSDQSPCTTNGPCGPAGQFGRCIFNGTCSAGGNPCSELGASCTGFGTCGSTTCK